MKIVCPSCDAVYEVPEKVVTSRRKMRCARCSTDWVPADTLAPLDGTDAPPLPPEARPQAFGKAASAPPPAEAGAWPPPEPAAPAGTGYVLVDPVPEPDLPEPEAHPEARRDDEPYQLALRPETHINVFATRDAGTVFGNASPLTARPVTKPPPVLAWLLSVLVLVAFIGGLVVFRESVMKIWPPSERLYAALGLVAQP